MNAEELFEQDFNDLVVTRTQYLGSVCTTESVRDEEILFRTVVTPTPGKVTIEVQATPEMLKNFSKGGGNSKLHDLLRLHAENFSRVAFVEG